MYWCPKCQEVVDECIIDEFYDEGEPICPYCGGILADEV